MAVCREKRINMFCNDKPYLNHVRGKYNGSKLHYPSVCAAQTRAEDEANIPIQFLSTYRRFQFVFLPQVLFTNSDGV